MGNKPAPNGIPKIIVIAQGNPLQHLIVFIPGFKKEWHLRMKQIEFSQKDPRSGQWLIPYSRENIARLENVFGKHILFAFKIGWLSGEHKTDK